MAVEETSLRCPKCKGKVALVTFPRTLFCRDCGWTGKYGKQSKKGK